MNCTGCPAMGVRTEKFPLLPDESNGLNHLKPVRVQQSQPGSITRRIPDDVGAGQRTVLWYSLAPIEMDKKINEDLFVD